MTSDAKIGLILGLVFIFIIAFIINGLPNLREDESSNELTTDMLGSHNQPAGLGARERKVREAFEPVEPPRRLSPAQEELAFDKVRGAEAEKPNVRFEMLLPDSTSVVKDVAKEKAAEDIKAVTRSKSSQSYVVSEGDNLAVIAKECYGAEEGNKMKNVGRIFEANRNQLKSPDDIYVGQKLIIPALSGPPEKKGVFPTMIFEKVKSIGRRAETDREYVVRQGDSLWKIAADQLGNGSRYSEISRLNAAVLEDEDSLDVGMRLRLPAQ